MSQVASPPSDLTEFPAFSLLPDEIAFRIHHMDYGPWWFNSRGGGRFDLPHPLGTCYLAAAGIGAFVEAFQRSGVTIPTDHVLTRRLSRLRVPHPIRLADATGSRARGFGLTGDIHSSTDRAWTQTWAMAFAAAGFQGIRYLVRHDPAQRQVGYALFGTSGAVDWPIESTNIIDEDLIRDVQERFGIVVLQLRRLGPSGRY